MVTNPATAANEADIDRGAAALSLVEGELPLEPEVVDDEDDAVVVTLIPEPEVLVLGCIVGVEACELMVVTGPVLSVVVAGLLLAPARQE